MRHVVLSSRPIAWGGLAVVYLVGLSFGGGSLDALTVLELLAFSIPFAFVLFTLNDVHDHASDAINTRRRSAANHLLHPSKHELAVRVALGSALLVLLIGALRSLGAGLEHFAIVFVTVSLGYLYSAPPVRLKERPVFDSISNGLIIVGILLVGFTTASSIASAPRQLLGMFFAGIAMHALYAIADRDPDAHAEMRTIATVLGVRHAAAVAFAAGLLLVLSGQYGSWLLVLGAHLVAGGALATLLSGSTRVALWSVQAATAYAFIAAPIYLAGLVI